MQGLSISLLTMSVENPTFSEFEKFYSEKLLSKIGIHSYYRLVTQGKDILTPQELKCLYELELNVVVKLLWTILYNRDMKCNVEILLYYRMCF